MQTGTLVKSVAGLVHWIPSDVLGSDEFRLVVVHQFYVVASP
jgi:hypothetical protein